MVYTMAQALARANTLANTTTVYRETPTLNSVISLTHNKPGNWSSEIVSLNNLSFNSGREHELRVFDPISETIANDPILRIAHERWNMYPRTLWFECNRLGVDRVRGFIRDVSRIKALSNPGGKLRKLLREAHVDT